MHHLHSCSSFDDDAFDDDDDAFVVAKGERKRKKKTMAPPDSSSWTVLVAFFSAAGFLIMVFKNNGGGGGGGGRSTRGGGLGSGDDGMATMGGDGGSRGDAFLHAHPLSDASRLARDKFERGQWRLEDRPKPLSKPQAEEVRYLGWTLYEETSWTGAERANRKMQRKEEMDFERRNRVIGERDIDVVRSEEDDDEDDAWAFERGEDEDVVDARGTRTRSKEDEEDDEGRNGSDDDRSERHKKCEAHTPCGVAFINKRECVDLCQSSKFEPDSMPKATMREKKDAFYLKTHFDFFQRKRRSGCSKNGLDHTLVIYHAPERVSFGKHLASVASGLARASAFNKTYVLGRLSMRQWTSAKRCGLNRNVMCYLKPIGKCLLDARDKDGRQIGASMAGTSMFGASGLFDFSVYRTKRRGTLMYQAEALSYVFEPNARAEGVIRAAFRDSIRKQAETMLQSGSGVGSFLGGQQQHVLSGDALERDVGHPFGKCVAVHVRRSGCVRDIESLEEPNRLEGLCVPSKKYMESAREFAEKYNLHSIVLISDDLKVAEKCASNTDLPCFYTTSTKRLLHDAENDVNDNLPSFKRRRNLLWKDSGKDRAVSAALATVIELEAARTCDAFVGQFLSGFSRLAYMLMSARMATPAPYHSVDGVPFKLE